MAARQISIASILAVLVVTLATAGAFAAVERVEISDRAMFAGGASFGDSGPYEKITGRIHYGFDPQARANALIVDLDLAPRDADGLVRAVGDFVLLRPVDPARGNRRLLYEVTNRGGLGMLSFFNEAPRGNDPRTREDAGNGHLLNEGYTLLWSGWNWDVVPADGRLQITLPIAVETLPDGMHRFISEPISAEIVTNFPALTLPVAWGGSRGYETVDLNDPEARLTVRARQSDPRREISRESWQFARVEDGALIPDSTHVTVRAGFEPGLIYELVYTARDPRVVGVGLASIRDILSFFRYESADSTGQPNPMAGTTDRVIVFGISQSGRVIQHMLWQGFHRDEAGRSVFDAALIHVPGGGKGSFNHRFAQTTRHPSAHEDHQYPADYFPFATVAQNDPVTGETGDLLARVRAAGPVPHLFYTMSSTEYWGRSASLLHADVTGARDLAFDPQARFYFLAGAQHGVWIFPERGMYRNCGNPIDQGPVMRALLRRLDDWTSDRAAPPDSVYPRIAEGTLGRFEDWRAQFPAIPDFAVVEAGPLAPPRLDLGPRWATEGIIDRVPPGFGPAFVTLVPLPDADGIDRGGIGLPEVAVPLGSYVGWNRRTESVGAGRQIGRWTGSFAPFARNAAARALSNDPRPSLAERYVSHDDYAARVQAAAERLHRKGFLLDRDIDQIVTRAGALYDRLERHLARNSESRSCAYLVPN